MDLPAKNYTVSEVAAYAKTSVRTLHFYDEVGILPPAFVGANGYRYYGQEQLSRLQDILFFRELGLSLEEIREILDTDGYDRFLALKNQRKQLEARAEHLFQLIATIDRTLRSMEENIPMKPDEMYQGVTPENQANYEKELLNRYGSCAEPAIAQSKRAMRGWSKADLAESQAVWNDLHREFTCLLRAGLPAEAAGTQALVRRHYNQVSKYWLPNRSAYIGLGQLYLDHPDFNQHYASFHPDLAYYLAQALRLFAERELSE